MEDPEASHLSARWFCFDLWTLVFSESASESGQSLVRVSSQSFCSYPASTDRPLATGLGLKTETMNEFSPVSLMTERLPWALRSQGSWGENRLSPSSTSPPPALLCASSLSSPRKQLNHS
uniref:Uncharacterized protein n=1 Tax=Knipowitschia caucasica TaxID=637954 RepID=A0AAV2KQX6_KNICA